MRQLVVQHQNQPVCLPGVPVNESGIQKRVRDFCSRSIKHQSKLNGLYMAVKMTDLTTLEGSDTRGKVRQLCNKGMNPLPAAVLNSVLGNASSEIYPVPPVAAICVYPEWVSCAKEALTGSPVKVASVATGFPAGNIDIDLKLRDVEQAVRAGADEIDMVIDRGAFLSGQYQRVFDEIVMTKAACGDKVHLKVILETAELGSLDKVRLASWIAMEAGADFIKTSTGKIPKAASMDVTLVMLYAIRDFYEMYGRQVGMKPAGGIKTAKQALQYLVMLLEVLGPAWMSPDWFRFGASSLLNDVLRQIVKQKTGQYYYPELFSRE